MNARALLGRIGSVLATAALVVTIGLVVVAVGAVAAGYRPVVLTSGSMGDTAPTGSLVVASPRSLDDLATGDVIVMRPPGESPVTHRIVAIERSDAGSFAVTRGDANDDIDPRPYPLGDEELVARWIVPGVGTTLTTLRDPRFGLAAASLVVAIAAAWFLRRIWTTDEGDDDHDVDHDGDHGDDHGDDHDDVDRVDGPETNEPAAAASTGRSRKQVAAAATMASALLCAGVVWSLHTSSLAVDANLFGTTDCFGAQLRSVQSGTTVHATNGVVTASIGPVDPARTFVMASVRSAGNEPADGIVRVRLAGSGTIELRRETDDPTPPAITVAWSAVEYDCGIAVQRGIATGDGTNRLDVAISSVDVTSSFVVVSELVPPTDADFGANELFHAELTAADTLTISGASGTAFPTGQSFGWQVVTFQHDNEIDVQTASATLGAGVTADTITLATPVERDSTFVTAFVTSDSAGPDIGERLVRAHLVDATTVAIDRSVGGDALDVRVQVVSLLDGTTVRHGTVDLASAVLARDVDIEPVDPARSTAVSTVAVPGVGAGGMTDHVADDVLGEGTATFALADADTVTITRGASASNASFGWQVVEWAGPSWWDTDYTFRQRIVVDASVATPDGYTVSLPIDHANLVSSGLSLAGGDDLRVLHWDGTAWTELDRVLDDASSWGLGDTTVLFRTTDPIAAGDAQIYWLYMANPAAGPAPADPEAVFLLVEDFETGDLGDFEDRTAGGGWYTADPWTRRIPLTIAAGTVGSTLTDFPLLVQLTDAGLAADAQADGSDIRFTAADGTTPLAHEIESFDAGTGALTAWVRVPSLPSSSATTLYLSYGAANAPAQDDVRGTWVDGVEAAWHLSRDPAGSAPQLDDATVRNHDGLSLGSMTGADLVQGLVGPAVHLDGADDGLQADRLLLEGRTAITVSAWVRLDALTTDASVFGKAADASTRQLDLEVRADGSVRSRLLLDGGEVQATTTAATVGTGAWHHVAARWDGTSLALVVDGTQRTSVPATGSIVPAHAMPVVIGNVVSQDRPLDGIVDEVRVETVARSLDWLAAAESNQRDPATFAVPGAVQTGAWFGQGAWSYRKPVVVDADQVPTDLTDHRLLVQVTDARLQASAQACACDLVFTGADGTTRLDHVVEAFDPGTGALTAWVLVPVLSGSEDTQLFLYYGNPTAVDQQDSHAVFGSDADLQLLGSP